MLEELIQFAQKALIINDGKLLIIRKSSKDINSPNKWETPGGRKIVGETLDQQIIREVKEEVGLDILPKDIYTMWEVNVSINNNPTTLVAVSRFCKTANDNVVITEKEIIDYKWVEINEDLLNYDIMKGLQPTIIKLVQEYSNISKFI